jgi:hypothetical protein
MSTGEYPDGTVYLLHLDPPYKHARHYTGHADPGRLRARLAAHAAGTGARLMQVVKDAGGSFRLARTWPGGRARERELKDRHEAPRLCPICTPHPLPAQANPAGRQAPARTPPAPAPVPPPARPPAYERGAAAARRAVQQQIDAGFPADRIAKVHARIIGALVPERAGLEVREEARGYRDTAQAMIAAHRQATAPQAQAEDERGLATVRPLVSASGTQAEPADITTWVTRALHDRIDRAAPPAGPDLEAEAGA